MRLQKFFTFGSLYGFNAIGFALAISLSLILLQYLIQEETHDDYRYKESLFRLEYIEQRKSVFIGNNINAFISENFQHSTTISKVHLQPYKYQLKAGDRNFLQDGVIFSDREFFKLFTPGFVEGDIPVSDEWAVITENTAIKYFGTTDVLGEIITVSGLGFEKNFAVSAVMEEVPGNHHLQYQVIISGISLPFWDHPRYSCGQYVLTTEKFENLSAALNRYAETDDMIEGKFIVNPIDNLYFDTTYAVDFTKKGNAKFLGLIRLIFFILMLIAGFNFFTMYQSDLLQRQKKLAIQKTLGASRWRIMKEEVLRTIPEVLIIMTCAVLIFYALERLDVNVGLNISEFIPIAQWIIIGIILYGVLALIKVFSLIRIYGNFDLVRRNELRFRNRSVYLMGFQFLILTVALGFFDIVSRQVELVSDIQSTGFTSDIQIIQRTDGMDLHIWNSFIRQLRSETSVSEVGLSTFEYFENGNTAQISVSWEENQILSYFNYVDAGFFPAAGLKIVDGRMFHENIERDSLSVIVNQSFSENGGEPGDFIAFEERQFEIIGIAENKLTAGLANAELPGVYFPLLGNRYLYFKTMDTGRLSEIWNSYFTLPLETNSFESRWWQLNADQLQAQRFSGFVLICLMLISLTGLISSVLFQVNNNLQSLSIQKVLGAEYRHLVLFLNRRLGVILAGGLVTGAAGAVFMGTQWLTGYTYQAEVSLLHVFLWAGGLLMIFLMFTTILTLWKVSFNPLKYIKQE